MDFSGGLLFKKHQLFQQISIYFSIEGQIFQISLLWTSRPIISSTLGLLEIRFLEIFDFQQLFISLLRRYEMLEKVISPYYIRLSLLENDLKMPINLCSNTERISTTNTNWRLLLRRNSLKISKRCCTLVWSRLVCLSTNTFLFSQIDLNSWGRTTSSKITAL
jgi:hypothetical protein